MITNHNHLLTALAKLDERTSKAVHLTPEEANALLAWLELAYPAALAALEAAESGAGPP